MSDRNNHNTIRSGRTRFVRLQKALFGLALAAAATTLLGFKLEMVASAHDHDESQDPVARHEVEDLITCYSLGTDAIGLAVNAVDNQPLDSTVNLSDPQFAAGLAYYRDCFAKNFTFVLRSNGVVLVTVPNPATRTPTTDAALQWANFVNNAFRPNYKATQHMQSTIATVITGRTAVTQNYLIATQVYAAGAAPLTGIQHILGTYTNEDVKVRGKWLIETRTLDITASVHIPAGL